MYRSILIIVLQLSSCFVAAESLDQVPVALSDGCRDVENIKWSADNNNYSPIGIVLHKLGYLADAHQAHYDLPEDITKTLKVRVIDAPQHGILVLNETRSLTLPEKLSWMYHANPAYQGPDRAIFQVLVNQQGYEVTVKYFVHAIVVENEHPYECENLQIGSLNLD